jgi:hypothetical protein
VGRSKLPAEVIRVIETAEIRWTDHAFDESFAEDAGRADVIAVARTADTWKRTTDKRGEAIDGFVDAVTGRDLRGRRMYLSGKRIRYDGVECWYVVTFHKAT